MSFLKNSCRSVFQRLCIFASSKNERLKTVTLIVTTVATVVHGASRQASRDVDDSLGRTVSPQADQGHREAESRQAGPDDVAAREALDLEADLLAVEVLGGVLLAGGLAVDVAEDLVASLHAGAGRRLLGRRGSGAGGRQRRQDEGRGNGGGDGEQRRVQQVRVAGGARRQGEGEEQRRGGEGRQGEDRDLEAGCEGRESVGG